MSSEQEQSVTKVYAVAGSVPEGCGYLTAGKRYGITYFTDGSPRIIDDEGDTLFINWRRCIHLHGGNWTRIKDAPPDDEGMEANTALMPKCPFCDGSDLFVERANLNSCYVICNDCGARGPTSCDETDADAETSEAGNCEPGEMSARRLWRARPAHGKPLVSRTPTPDAVNADKAVDAHFRRMQEACANYLEPTTYVARHPDLSRVGDCPWVREFHMPEATHSPEAVKSINDRRDAAFISDIIYMLDGPEQRAAQATPAPDKALMPEAAVGLPEAANENIKIDQHHRLASRLEQIITQDQEVTIVGLTISKQSIALIVSALRIAGAE